MKVTNDIYLERKVKYFPNVTDAEWNDWHWQIKNRIRFTEDLAKYLPLTKQEKLDMNSILNKFRMSITPYYLCLIDPDNPKCPIRLQAVPSVQEMHIGKFDMEDPLAEDIIKGTFTERLKMRKEGEIIKIKITRKGEILKFE